MARRPRKCQPKNKISTQTKQRQRQNGEIQKIHRTLHNNATNSPLKIKQNDKTRIPQHTGKNRNRRGMPTNPQRRKYDKPKATTKKPEANIQNTVQRRMESNTTERPNVSHREGSLPDSRLTNRQRTTRGKPRATAIMAEKNRALRAHKTRENGKTQNTMDSLNKTSRHRHRRTTHRIPIKTKLHTNKNKQICNTQPQQNKGTY